MNCQAIVHKPGKSYSMQRIRTYDSVCCSRQAVETVKHLSLCTTHAKTARAGWMYETGETVVAADRSGHMRSEDRKYDRAKSSVLEYKYQPFCTWAIDD